MPQGNSQGGEAIKLRTHAATIGDRVTNHRRRNIRDAPTGHAYGFCAFATARLDKIRLSENCEGIVTTANFSDNYSFLLMERHD
jgi:hypothetical protein